MRQLHLQKPVIGKQTGLGQAFKQFLSDIHLPINEFANRQVAKKWK